MRHTGILSFLREKILGKKEIALNDQLFCDPEFQSLLAGYYIRELAFESVVNLIARSISKCEFKTFQNGKEVKAREYYMFNIEPNRNQNSSAFIHKWIYQLYRNNECLIVDVGGSLLVADSFERTPYALLDDIFTNVTVGTLMFERSFAASEVLYYQLGQQNMKRITDGIYESYVGLISHAMKAYQKSQGIRGTMTFSAMAQGIPGFQENMKKFVTEQMKPFLTEDNAVLPLYDGWTYNELQKRGYANDSTRDIRAMIDDVSDFTAKGFGIPPALLRGDVAGLDSALDMLLTFCVDPLCDMLQEEINRKRNGYDGFQKGNYVQIDTKAIKHVDLLSVSMAIDKLIGSGAFCVNDIRLLVGEQIIDEPWAWQHWMTKNYAATEELLNALGGGAGDAQQTREGA
ncbi:phage portal protein [Eubacteriales bacterium OttesenSCG-928-A19]|nr:phage portal protein [Eubacteriales bacterium OttesenSCG-928-A19]